jgi:tetratricopeptide (TPR) repeat protein
VLNWSEQWIRLGFSPEPAYRALMTAHAGLGNLVMIGATYQRCVEALNRELGIEPSAETTSLYEQFRRGKLDGFVSPPIFVAETGKKEPHFFENAEPRQIEKPLVVARERELEAMSSSLNRALAGQGRVIWITGEAGSGKTTLVNEFIRRAQEAHQDLIVAWGNCNAHTGIGDPYLPFREILALLSGDVEARWSAGAISKEHASFLWNIFPITAQALMETGPDLIDTFISGTALFGRAMEYAPGGADWLARLERFLKDKRIAIGAGSPQQSDLFMQYSKVLHFLAQKNPMVLVIDDLQWADLGSISLLFHLGRILTGSRILIIGAYREEDVAMGRGGERHPLEQVVNETQRISGEKILNVDQAKSRDFVGALLDSETNRLGSSFRQLLYLQTRGHPLFTIEVLRGMQERGDLVRDQDGYWVEGSVLDWETLPVRVEVVLAERIGRLDRLMQSILRTASVEGEMFTAEVVARVLAIKEEEVLERLSGELYRKHHLILAQSIQRIDGQLLSLYRFRHILVQKYLYNSLDEVERVHLHEQVGTAMEKLYEKQDAISTITPQLARHFEEARKYEKAIYYLHQAGERAQQMSAYQEAIGHLTKGLALLANLPYPGQHALQELSLQVALGISLHNVWASSHQQIEQAFARARELCQQTGETTRMCQVLSGLSIIQYARAEHRRALELAENSFVFSQQAGDPLLEAVGRWNLGVVLYILGEYPQAFDHLQHLSDFYDPGLHHQESVFLRGVDVGLSGLSYYSCCLWALGFPDQAARKSREVIILARKYNHSFTLADVLCYAGCQLSRICRDAQALLEFSDELFHLSREKNFIGWLADATCSKGEALIMLGRIQEGIQVLEEGITSSEEVGTLLHVAGNLSTLAEAYLLMGNLKQGWTTLHRAFEYLERSDERHWETELYRTRAALEFAQGEYDNAEISIKKSLEVARRQCARSWELRAAIELAHLWRKQGRLDEARSVVTDVYSWFTEGFDTPDLIKAKTLLDSLT